MNLRNPENGSRPSQEPRKTPLKRDNLDTGPSYHPSNSVQPWLSSGLFSGGGLLIIAGAVMFWSPEQATQLMGLGMDQVKNVQNAGVPVGVAGGVVWAAGVGSFVLSE
jgi:hypothetical protein